MKIQLSILFTVFLFLAPTIVKADKSWIQELEKGIWYSLQVGSQGDKQTVTLRSLQFLPGNKVIWEGRLLPSIPGKCTGVMHYEGTYKIEWNNGGEKHIWDIISFQYTSGYYENVCEGKPSVKVNYKQSSLDAAGMKVGFKLERDNHGRAFVLNALMPRYYRNERK